MRVLTTGLEGPWEIAWGPDQQLWVTERTGRRVIAINPADGMRSRCSRSPRRHTTFTQDGSARSRFSRRPAAEPRGNDFVYVAFTYDDAPGTGAGETPGNSTVSIRSKARTLVQADGCHDGTPDDTTTTSAADWPSVRDLQAVSDHRRSGQQLRRKPLQRQSRAGPSDRSSR